MRASQPRIMTFALLVFPFFVTVLTAEVQQPDNRSGSEGNYSLSSCVERTVTRNVPDYSFMLTPQVIHTTYYDYMPGSYLSYPLRVQNNQTPGTNGIYVGFHSCATANAERRAQIYYYSMSYDATMYCTTDPDLRQGYVGLDIDPVMNDPIFTWHSDVTENGVYECELIYDLYHILNSPGLLTSPFHILEQSEYAGIHSPANDDEFIWPYIHIVKAPTYAIDGSRRIFVLAMNYTTHSESPSENVIIKWADYTSSNLDNMNLYSLDWSYITFPMLDSYNIGPTWGRYSFAAAFNDDGQCALIGYLKADDLGNNGCDTDLLVFYNDNWGEGDWSTVQTSGDFYLTAPAHQDGSSIFEGVDVGDPICFSFKNASHAGARFDGQGRLHFVGSMFLGHIDDSFHKSYWPYFGYVKGMVLDPTTMTLTMQDIYPQSTCEDPVFPYIPWDANQDGQYEYDPLGFLVKQYGWPIWWYDWDDAYHENLFKIAASENGEWMACVWQDGLYNRYYNEDGYNEYADWATCPEIAISVSADYGDHWSEPIFMNANPSAETGYCPELAGMIPEYVYPGDIIEDMGDDHGKLHLFFLDDNTFGSYIQGNGQHTGGTLYYTALDIDFGDLFTFELLPPQNISIEIRNHVVVITWDPSPEASIYNVYSSYAPDAPDEAWVLEATTSSPEWFGETPQQRRFYRVKALTSIRQ